METDGRAGVAITGTETEKGRTVEPDHDQEDARDDAGCDATAVGLNVGQAWGKPRVQLRCAHGLPVEIV